MFTRHITNTCLTVIDGLQLFHLPTDSLADQPQSSPSSSFEASMSSFVAEADARTAVDTGRWGQSDRKPSAFLSHDLWMRLGHTWYGQWLMWPLIPWRDLAQKMLSRWAVSKRSWSENCSQSRPAYFGFMRFTALEPWWAWESDPHQFRFALHIPSSGCYISQVSHTLVSETMQSVKDMCSISQ